MKVIKHPSREQWNEFLTRPYQDMTEIKKTVQTIIEDIKVKKKFQDKTLELLKKITASFFEKRM
jgi:hypothetical protein